MKYKYKILNVNDKERWINIRSDVDFDYEEPDSFVYFVKMIRGDVNGTAENIGYMRYSIKNDGYGFIYQWDSLFGITVIYPQGVTEKQAREFLGKYMSEFQEK